MVKTVYQKYCDGDTLTDKEVVSSYRHFSNAEIALSNLGAEFTVTRKECTRMVNNLYDIARARNIVL